MAADFDEDELYRVVRQGVRDGIWDVLEVVITIAVGIVLFVIGVALLQAGAARPGGVPGLASLVVGAVLVLGSVYHVFKQLGIGPFR